MYFIAATMLGYKDVKWEECHTRRIPRNYSGYENPSVAVDEVQFNEETTTTN